MSGDDVLEDLKLKLLLAERVRARLAAENEFLRQEISSAHNVDEIIGASPGLVRVLENVSRVAPTDSSVLISGEPGTGKELIARAIHGASHLARGPFIKLDCTALFDQEFDLGRYFTLAAGGTIFFDEVAALKPEMQAAVLHALKEREPARAASVNALPTARVIAATNRDLRRAMRAQEFREDLFYRLNVFPLELPPLRARADDIPLLVQFFAHKYAPRVGRRVDGVDPDTLMSLSRYTWPGNIRELENLVQRALILNTSPLLKIPSEMMSLHAPSERSEVAAAATGMYRTLSIPSATSELDDIENTGLHFVQREHILRVLNATHWVIEGNSGAALKLGLKPATLRHRMKKLGISRAQNPHVAS